MKNFILLWLITIFRQEQNYIRIREHAKEIGLSDIKMRKSYFLYMDFSLFKTITQRVSVLNNNPPAMRVETICYTKKSPIRYNIVVQATIVRKDGDFNG